MQRWQATACVPGDKSCRISPSITLVLPMVVIQQYEPHAFNQGDTENTP